MYKRRAEHDAVYAAARAKLPEIKAEYEKLAGAANKPETSPTAPK